MALKLSRAEVDMTPATFEWEGDPDIKIVGVPSTPRGRREAAKRAGIKVNDSGVSVIETTFDAFVETAYDCFRSWEGIVDEKGKAYPITRETIARVMEQERDIVADAVVFFRELYEQRAEEREEAEGNS